MSKQRLVETCFWDDAYIMKLDPSEKLLFLYLLTNPLTNICGVYQIEMRRIAFDTGFEIDTVKRMLTRLERDGRCLYRDGWVAMKNWLKHQKAAPGVQRGIEIQLAKIPNELAEYIKGVQPPSNLHLNLNPNLNLNSNSKLEDMPAPPPAKPDESPFSKQNVKKQTDESLKPLVLYFAKRHAEPRPRGRGYELTIFWSRDMAIMRDIRKGYKPEAIRQCIDAFFDWQGRTKTTLRDFAGKVDTIYGVLKDKAEGRR